MALLLSCRDLTRSFGSRPLFEGLTFGLNEGERTGLIGPNGAGKSTLLKILAGLEKCDGGELSIRRGVRVNYLAQTDEFDGGVRANSSDSAAVRNSRPDPATHDAPTVRDTLVAALQGMDLEDWEIDIRVDDGLEGSGFNPDQPVESLSGGWRKRLAILAQVLRKPDLLLLDEPTNHLDLEGVLWLERFLNGLEFSFLVVTHDRRFLESVCNRVIELNPRYFGGHFSSVGNYSQFVENREALIAGQAAREESARNIVRREIEWLRKGPRARTTKQKARIDRAGVLIDDLAELSFRNAQDRSANIDFTSSARRSKSLVEAIEVSKKMGGRKLFGPLNLNLGPGEKLGLLGGNGSGKSTLLKLLAGQLEPDSGRMKRAEALKVVTFDQQREQLDLKMTLRIALCERGDFVEYKGNPVHVIGWAERFLFDKSQLEMPLSRLSGGEQARVLIARLMLRPADLLLLDEPTNDLDINSLEVLETSMLDFAGALVLVTHDRYLLDRVSDRILALDGRGGAEYFADLAQWEEWERSTASTQSPAAVKIAEHPPVKAKLTPEEAKELKSLAGRISSAETERDRAAKSLLDPAIAADAAELIKRQNAVNEAQERVDAYYRRWEELEK